LSLSRSARHARAVMRRGAAARAPRPLHALPGDAECDADDDGTADDALSLLNAVSRAHAPLPAALAWLRRRAARGALAALPDALARDATLARADDGDGDGDESSAWVALPPALCAASPRPALCALPPPAPAALLHALRIEARTRHTHTYACSHTCLHATAALQQARSDAAFPALTPTHTHAHASWHPRQARLFPRDALLRLAAVALSPHARLDAHATAAAHLLRFDLGAEDADMDVDAGAPLPRAAAAPAEAAAGAAAAAAAAHEPCAENGENATAAAAADDDSAAAASAAAAPLEDDASAAACALGAALAALDPLTSSADEGPRLASALLLLLSRAPTDAAAAGALAAARMEALPDGAAAAVASALGSACGSGSGSENDADAATAATALGYARTCGLLGALLLPRLRALRAPAPRPLAQALACAAAAAPAACATAVGAPLLLHAESTTTPPAAPQAEALVRILTPPAGGADASTSGADGNGNTNADADASASTSASATDASRRFGAPLLGALCAPGAPPWGEPAVSVAQAALALRLPLSRDALDALASALETAASEVPTSLKLCRLLLSVVALYGPQARCMHACVCGCMWPVCLRARC
jgi:hypothetical protein